MSASSRHCPFLNRDDERCGEHFHVGQLDHTFRYCFGNYAACPSYLDLLIERRTRRSSDRSTDRPVVTLTIRGRTSSPTFTRPRELALQR